MLKCYKGASLLHPEQLLTYRGYMLCFWYPLQMDHHHFLSLFAVAKLCAAKFDYVKFLNRNVWIF